VSRHLVLCAITSLLMRATHLVGQEPHVSTQAPPDQPVSVTSDEQRRRLDAAVAPYIAQARATYPQAKDRYLSGLPPQQSLFVTVELRDAAGHSEMAFLAVDSLAATASSAGSGTRSRWSADTDCEIGTRWLRLSFSIGSLPSPMARRRATWWASSSIRTDPDARFRIQQRVSSPWKSPALPSCSIIR
jgi:hypothetical protein